MRLISGVSFKRGFHCTAEFTRKQEVTSIVCTLAYNVRTTGCCVEESNSVDCASAEKIGSCDSCVSSCDQPCDPTFQSKNIPSKLYYSNL